MSTALFTDKIKRTKVKLQTHCALRTCPAAGGGMRDCGNGGMAAPHSLQKRANGSDGRGAKQLVHLQQFTRRFHNNNFLSVLGIASTTRPCLPGPG